MKIIQYKTFLAITCSVLVSNMCQSSSDHDLDYESSLLIVNIQLEDKPYNPDLLTEKRSILKNIQTYLSRLSDAGNNNESIQKKEKLLDLLTSESALESAAQESAAHELQDLKG